MFNISLFCNSWVIFQKFLSTSISTSEYSSTDPNRSVTSLAIIQTSPSIYVYFQNLQFNEEFPWEKNILQPFGTWNDFKKGSQVGFKNWRDKKNRNNNNKVDRNRERSYSVHEGQNNGGKESVYSAVHEGQRDSFEIINQQRHDSLEDDEHTHHTHLCFCCDDMPFLADDLQRRKRKKRTVKIGT